MCEIRSYLCIVYSRQLVSESKTWKNEGFMPRVRVIAYSSEHMAL